MHDLSILLIGDTGRSEFREASVALTAQGRVARFPTADSALTALSNGTVVPTPV